MLISTLLIFIDSYEKEGDLNLEKKTLCVKTLKCRRSLDLKDRKF